MNVKIYNQYINGLVDNPNVAHLMCFLDWWMELRYRPMPTQFQLAMTHIDTITTMETKGNVLTIRFSSTPKVVRIAKRCEPKKKKKNNLNSES